MSGAWTAAHERALDRARQAVTEAVEATRDSESRIRVATVARARPLRSCAGCGARPERRCHEACPRRGRR
jgi:hypothetical protein